MHFNDMGSLLKCRFPGFIKSLVYGAQEPAFENLFLKSVLLKLHYKTGMGCEILHF